MIYELYKIERFLYKIKIVPIAFLIRLFLRIVFSCDIPYKAKIGKNCDFPHYALGTVIHPETVIGDNCKILQGVTIGGRSGYSAVPIIGDNVLLGANSVLIGPIKIGNNAKIGAGSVVIHDVEENEVVAGVPAKHIKYIGE